MDIPTIKIHAFFVDFLGDSNLQQVVGKLNSLNFAGRSRKINEVKIQLQGLESYDNGLWVGDFVNLRSRGSPGIASDMAEIRAVEYAENERPGEETAVLFDPRTSHILVQYNHHGVKRNAIELYLNNYTSANGSCEVKDVPGPELIESLTRQTSIVKTLSLSFAPQSFVNNRSAARGLGLQEVLDFGNRFRGASVRIEISAPKRDGGLDRSVMCEFLRRMSGRSGNREQLADGRVKSAKCIVEEPDEGEKILDLAGGRMYVSEDVSMGDGRRLDRQSRYQALFRAYGRWCDDFTIRAPE